MKYFIGFLVACVLWLLALHNVTIPEYKVYDCRIAEMHPDYPIEVKEECRRRIYEEWKRDEEKVRTGVYANGKSLCRAKSCSTT